MGSWIERDAAVVWHGFTQMATFASNAPIIVERAEGRELIDVDGRRYLDAISSLWVTTLGHRVPELDAALIEQAGRVAHSTMLGNGNRVVVELAWSRPIHLDAVAARYPELPVVMAHFGYPWHLEALAIALHKTNVHIELSGWAPRRVPEEVVREAEGRRLGDRVLWGSDAPFFAPERALKEWEEILTPGAFRRVVRDNAARLLNLPV